MCIMLPWERGLEHHPQTIFATPITRCCRSSAGELAGAAAGNWLLPRRICRSIYLINALHLASVRKRFPDDDRLLSSASLIDESNGRRVRMSHLAFVGAHRINGVSALHTGLLRETVFHDLHTLFPDRIVNVTNGITFRRWLHEANPRLTALLVDALGPEVLDQPDALERLRPLAGDAAFQELFALAKWHNKLALAELIQRPSSASASIPRRCSMCKSSASTNTSASCSISWKPSRSTTRSVRGRWITGRRG